MGAHNTTETQYSIYKINFEAVKNVFADISQENDTEIFADKVISRIVNSIKHILSMKNGALQQEIQYQGFKGIIFKTIHYPAWDGIATKILENNESTVKNAIPTDELLINTNVSYVYLYRYNESVFAVTGGYGSNYISKFVEKNFGLYLLPKLIQRDNSVIKSVQQNNLLGNQTASQRTNRNSTSIQSEQDMSSIFRQLSIEADREIAENLGVSFKEDESTKKKVNIVNKDSIVIHRSISFDELKALIKRLYELEKCNDNFALNYLVLARKKRLKNNDLYETMVEGLSNGLFENFILTGDDYTTFFTAAYKYSVFDNQTNEIILESENPVTFADVVNALGEKKNSKSKLRQMLKGWSVSAVDNAGNYVLYPIPVFEALQGFIEFGKSKTPCYLFNGQWYVFDSRFDKMLSDEYKNIYSSQLDEQTRLCKKFNLRRVATSEAAYNQQLKKEGKILVTHTALIDRIEVADAIIFEEDRIYLMHNKDKFIGIGARDVTNQVLTSSAYLQNKLSSNKDSFLNDYYDRIESKYKQDKIAIPMTKEDFKSRFQMQPRICYLIGYISGYRENSESTYAKYLTVETFKKLEQRGYNCISIKLNP